MYKEEFIKKVFKLAFVKYELNEDVMEAFEEDIDLCWKNDFSPMRTVEFIADKIF